MKIFLAALIINLLIPLRFAAPVNPDAILGKWETIDHRLIIDVYKENQDYKAKIIWFKDISDQVMHERCDEKNPDKALRTRKWLGMEVLKNLRFDPGENEWIDGVIYDAKHGRYWDSVVWIDDDDLLNVKGYWVFKFVSETLTFRKIAN
ncbi:MAG: DUF2147 domain-containing protein [Ginsengibacter sp.]